MNKRSFLKTITLAACLNPLTLFAKKPPFHVQEIFYLGQKWIPTSLSLDSIIQAIVNARQKTDPCYAVIIEYNQDRGAWDCVDIFHNFDWQTYDELKFRWSTHLFFNALGGHQGTVEKLFNKNRYYLTFINHSFKPYE